MVTSVLRSESGRQKSSDDSVTRTQSAFARRRRDYKPRDMGDLQELQKARK